MTIKILMLFLYISLISCYKISFNLKPNIIQKLPEYFHFQEQGKYSISVDSSKQKIFPVLINLFICQKSEYKKFDQKNNPRCMQSFDIYIDSNSTIGNIHGTVEKSGAYQILVLSSGNSAESSITISLQNKKSYLDLYAQPCLYLEPIFLSIFCLLMVYWAINSIIYNLHNFSLCQTNFHRDLTKSYLLIIITSSLKITYLWIQHKYNKTKPYDNLLTLSSLFEYLFIFYSLSMSACGLSIVNDSISLSIKIINLFISFILSVPLINLIYMESSIYTYFSYVECFVFTILFYFIFRNLIEKTSKVLIAHLYVIGEEGIQPLTTPIYDKFLLFRKISLFLKVFFWLFIIINIVIIFCSLYFLNLILFNLILLLYSIYLGYFYRYQNGIKKGYMKINDIDYSAQPKHILKSTVDQINVHNFEINSNSLNNDQSDDFDNPTKIHWVDGMSLPPCPVIVNSLANIDQSNENIQDQNEPNDKDDENLEKNSDEETVESIVSQIKLDNN